MNVRKFVADASTVTREKGAAAGARWLLVDQNWHHHAAYYAYRALGARRTFTANGREYPYFYHKYNHTWRNERCVEIPLARRALEEARGKRVLEVGNVLAHYVPGLTHDVVDKYEVAPGVKNEDVVDYAPARPYDLVLTVSTLEHVGWDESPRDPAKIARAVEHLKEKCVAPGGRLVATVPVGYHPGVADLANDGKTFDRVTFLMRVNRRNDWREASWDDVKDARCGSPWPGANAIALCEWARG